MPERGEARRGERGLRHVRHDQRGPGDPPPAPQSVRADRGETEERVAGADVDGVRHGRRDPPGTDPDREQHRDQQGGADVTDPEDQQPGAGADPAFDRRRDQGEQDQPADHLDRGGPERAADQHRHRFLPQLVQVGAHVAQQGQAHPAAGAGEDPGGHAEHGQRHEGRRGAAYVPDDRRAVVQPQGVQAARPRPVARGGEGDQADGEGDDECDHGRLPRVDVADRKDVAGRTTQWIGTMRWTEAMWWIEAMCWTDAMWWIRTVRWIGRVHGGHDGQVGDERFPCGCCVAGRIPEPTRNRSGPSTQKSPIPGQRAASRSRGWLAWNQAQPVRPAHHHGSTDMGFNFDEAKKKLNLDETLDKVAKVVKETVDQIDDAIEKGRETLSEKLEPKQEGEAPTAEPGPTPQPGPDAEPGPDTQPGPDTPPGEGENAKPDYTI
ncbi:hypothetical protein SDC9_87938 [bioreactor metagenome]|uniref:Uncharacterized protein n=2 Tax=root TaxID=1 RepID=A0A644ZLQ5_9ZZZZ